jgi:hypothetical protein
MDSMTIRLASDNEPTDPKLWEKVQALTKGEIKSLRHDGETIQGPNDGKGFRFRDKTETKSSRAS